MVTMVIYLFMQSLCKLRSPKRLTQGRTMCQIWGNLRSFSKVPMQNLNPGVLISQSFFPFPSSRAELCIFESQTCVTAPDCLCTSKDGKSLLSVIAREGFPTKRGLIEKCGNEYTGERKARRCSRWKITGAQRWGSVRLAPGKCRHQEGSVEWWRALASCGKKSLRSGWLGTIRNSYIILLKHRSPNQSHCAKLNVPEEPGLPEAFMVS